MRPGILITNNHVGNHSADSWAMATAEQLVPLDKFKPEEGLAARKFQIKVAEALVEHHENVQTFHKDGLEEHSHDYLWLGYDPTGHVEAALEAIIAASVGSPLEKYYTDPTVQEEVGAVLANHFNTSHLTEMLAHCDKNPGEPNVQVFKDQHHPGMALAEDGDGETFMRSNALDNHLAGHAVRDEVRARVAGNSADEG